MEFQRLGCHFSPLYRNKMPNKHKNTKNSTRKSNASSQSKVSVSVSVKSDADDDWGSILVKSTPSSKKSTPSSKKTTPTSPRPEFLEPLSPTPIASPPPPKPWEDLGMTEEDFHAMEQRVKKQMMEDMRKTYINNLLEDLDSPSYWRRRIELLEKEREVFNKKRGWSAADVACVEQIDAEIQECENEIESIYAYIDRCEYECD